MISIVIPVYNTKNTIIPLCEDLQKVVSHLNQEIEIILIDDRSPDQSWPLILEYSKHKPYIKALRFSRNFGQHTALSAGLDYACGDWTVVMDCDFQDSPDQIIKLYNKAQEGFDVVLARRSNRQDSFLKKIFSFIFSFIFQRLSGLETNHEIGNFRIMNKKVLNAYQLYREDLRFFTGTMSLLGFNKTSIPVAHNKRTLGKSSYNFSKSTKLAITAIISHSNRPLYLSSLLGFFFILASLTISFAVLYKKVIHGVEVEGWTSIIISIFLMGGLNLGFMGIFGLYLGKIFDQTKQRPLYIVDEKINL